MNEKKEVSEFLDNCVRVLKTLFCTLSQAQYFTWKKYINSIEIIQKKKHDLGFKNEYSCSCAAGASV